MLTIKAGDTAEKLNTHETLRDYMGKINTVCPLALVHHQQDEHGATLVVHVPAGDVAIEQAKAKLGERLGELIADFPAAETVSTEIETAIIETGKAVVDVTKPAKSTKKKAATQDDSEAVTGD